MEYQYRSVSKLHEKAIRDNWDRPALSNYHGATMTFGDVALHIARMHLAFGCCGLKKGDKVAISPDYTMEEGMQVRAYAE